jgi:RNA polymerase sigma-70 factor, ECF subfamily
MGLVKIVPGRPRRDEGADPLAHLDALHRLARFLTRSAAEAEDLVQETYVRAFDALDRFAPGTDLEAWLFRILRNARIDALRRAGHSPVEAGAPPDLDERPAEDPWLMGDVELGRLRRLVGRDIEEALRSLSEDARTVVLLDAEGFTEAEVAEVVGCAVGTVKSRLSRARAALRERLAPYGRWDG